MLFLCLSFYKPGIDALRAEHREAHFAHLRAPNVQSLQFGPLINEKGDNIAACMIVEADSLEDVHRFHDNDPFTRAGLFDRVIINEWRKNTGEAAPKN